MLIIIRSKARSGQPPDHVAPTGEDWTNFPWRLNGPRQGKAVVVDSADKRSPSLIIHQKFKISNYSGKDLSRHSQNLSISFLVKIQVVQVQSSFPIVEKLTKINHKNDSKTISTFDFSTLYTIIPHNLLIKVLNKIISFVFNYKKNRSWIFRIIRYNQRS